MVIIKSLSIVLFNQSKSDKNSLFHVEMKLNHHSEDIK